MEKIIQQGFEEIVEYSDPGCPELAESFYILLDTRPTDKDLKEREEHLLKLWDLADGRLR